MMIPLQCSAFLVPPRNNGLMRAAHSANAKYLFQEDKLNASLDTGDLSVQCGRKVDVVKMWAAWASIGSTGYDAHINCIMDLARYLEARIQSRADAFALVTEGMCTNVCFWFVPPSVRTLPPSPSTSWSEEKRAAVHAAAIKVKERMQQEGTLMVGYQSIKINAHPEGAPNFFRMVIVSSENDTKNMDFVLDEIERLGSDL